MQEQRTPTTPTPLAHTLRRSFTAPMHARIEALRKSMVAVVKARIEEWVASGEESRISMEEPIVLQSSDHDTLLIAAVDLDKDGNPIAIVLEDMSSNETKDRLEYLPLDILAQIVDDLAIPVPDKAAPQPDLDDGCRQILAAFEATRDAAEALKEQLLKAIAWAQGNTEPDILELSLVEPPSDEDLAKLYPPDELDDAIARKDDADNIDCFAEFTARAEELGYRCLFTHDRVAFYAKEKS